MGNSNFRLSRKISLAMVLLLNVLPAFIACTSPKTPTTTETPSVSYTETVAETALETETTPVTAPPVTRPTLETTAESPTEETTAVEPSETESESHPDEDEIEWLPMDGASYVMGDPISSSLGANHYTLFTENHRYYLGEAFTLYGLYILQDEIPCLSFGTGMNIPVQFCDGAQAPVEGSFVKVSAVYGSPSPENGIPYTYVCMMASTVEILDAPEADEPIWYVIAEILFVRSTPDSNGDANKVGSISKGTAVRILEHSCGDSGEWCKIAFDSDFGYGYVKAVYLAENPLP